LREFKTERKIVRPQF